MSTRWMAVQFIGDTLRLPIANKSDMDMPFGSSTLERDVRRIVVNPFSDSPQVFVPEAENAKLRELVQALVRCMNDVDCDKCPLNGNPYEVRGEWAACDALRDLLDELKEDE